MASHSDAMVRAAVRRNSALSLAKSISIGLKSAAGAPPAANPSGRRQLADAQPASRPARRKTALNRADDADPQIARIRPRHAVPQQHLWAHSRSIHHIWKSQPAKISKSTQLETALISRNREFTGILISVLVGALFGTAAAFSGET